MTQGKRRIKVIDLLILVQEKVWDSLFGKKADGLEQSMDDPNEYRIIEKQPVTNRFVSQTHPNCSYFIAGIIEGVLTSNGMECKVVPHLDHSQDQTIFVVKFTDEVMQKAGDSK